MGGGGAVDQLLAQRHASLADDPGSGESVYGDGGLDRSAGARRSLVGTSRHAHSGSWRLVDRIAAPVGCLGAAHRQAGLVAGAVFRTAASLARGVRRRLAAPGREPAAFGAAAGHRRSAGRRDRFCRRGRHRLVDQHRLLVAPGVAHSRAGALDGVAAAVLLPVSHQLECQCISDRPGDLVPGDGADLVRRGQRRQGVLRRGPDPGREAGLPDFQSGDPGGLAPRVRGSVHGAGRFVLDPGGRGNDGGQGRHRLVPAMGPGLGCLRQYVCGAVDHGTGLLGADLRAVPGP